MYTQYPHRMCTLVHIMPLTQTPHSQISCLPSPTQTKRPRTLDPRPWFCQLKPGQSTGCTALTAGRRGWGGAGVVPVLGWFSQPTCKPPFSPLSPAAGCHSPPAWLLVYVGHDVHTAHKHPHPDTRAYGLTPSHVLMCILTPLLTSAAKGTLNLQRQGPGNELGVFSRYVN